MNDGFQSPLSPQLDTLWEGRARLSPHDEDAAHVVWQALEALDSGQARVASVRAGDVLVDERARRAIMLAFKVFRMTESATGAFTYRDRLPLKSSFPGVRVVPGAVARFGSHAAPGAVLMPSFVNVGAHIGEGTMIDTWATVGSCAQVGRRVHVAGGVGIGGVLEPVGARPVVVDDDAFLGSRSMIVEGARVREGAKIGAGALLTATTRVFDAATGDELRSGEAPAWSVCVGATRPRSFAGGEFGIPCLLVVKRLTPGAVHEKLVLDQLFREHGVF